MAFCLQCGTGLGCLHMNPIIAASEEAPDYLIDEAVQLLRDFGVRWAYEPVTNVTASAEAKVRFCWWTNDPLRNQAPGHVIVWLGVREHEARKNTYASPRRFFWRAIPTPEAHIYHPDISRGDTLGSLHDWLIAHGT